MSLASLTNGLGLAADTTPLSSTLVSAPGMIDGNLTTYVTNFTSAASVSAGAKLTAAAPITSVILYDTVASSGFYASAFGIFSIFTSSNNSTWAWQCDIPSTLASRVSGGGGTYGVTTLPLPATVSAQYVKVLHTGTIKTPANAALQYTEIQVGVANASFAVNLPHLQCSVTPRQTIINATLPSLTVVFAATSWGPSISFAVELPALTGSLTGMSTGATFAVDLPPLTADIQTGSGLQFAVTLPKLRAAAHASSIGRAEINAKLPKLKVGAFRFGTHFAVKLPKLTGSAHASSVGKASFAVRLPKLRVGKFTFGTQFKVTLPKLKAAFTASSIGKAVISATLPKLKVKRFSFGTVINVTLPKLKASITASSIGKAVVVAKLPKLKAGNFRFGTTFSATLPKLKGAAHLSSVGKAKISATLPKLKVGQFRFGTSFAVKLPKLKGTATAKSPNSARLIATLPKLKAYVHINNPGHAGFNVTLPALRGKAALSSGTSTSFAVTLPSLRGTAHGTQSGSLSFSVILPKLKCTILASEWQHTSFAVTLPGLEFVGYINSGLSQPETVTAIVMNTETMAITEYLNFPFNSFGVRADGSILAAGPGGLYLLEGADDNGTPIAALVSTALADFGNTFLKRIDEAIVDYTGSAVSVSTVVDGEVVGATNTMVASASGTHADRFKPGKGLKSRAFGFDISNVNGGDLQLKDVEARMETLSRKI